MITRAMESHSRRVMLVGRYDASDLQRAMRVVLARADLRAYRLKAAQRLPIGCDVKTNGRLVAL